MNRYPSFGIVLVGLISSTVAFGQQNTFHAAVNGTVYHESRAAFIYGQGNVERNSSVVNGTVGTRVLFMLAERFKIGAGFSYVSRRYDMSRPFNHCYFNEPGDPCEYILAHVDWYKYKTIEIPISIDFQFWKSGDWMAFAGVTWSGAYILNATYHTKIPNIGILEDRGFTLFSTSILAQLTCSYRLNHLIIFNAAPFIRIAGKQHGDEILFEQSSEWIATKFDSFGLMMEVQVKLGK